MIDVNMANAIANMNDRETDAMGYTTPGYQAKFHDAMELKQRSTGVPDPLSVSAPSMTFFVVQNADGSRAYTRSGNFHVRDGQLTTSDGRQVLGYPAGRTQGPLVPMTLPAGTPDGWVNIAADGTVSVADPKDVQALDRGNAKLALALDGRTGLAALPADDGSDTRLRAQQNAVDTMKSVHGLIGDAQSQAVTSEAMSTHPETLDANMMSTSHNQGHFMQSLTAPNATTPGGLLLAQNGIVGSEIRIGNDGTPSDAVANRPGGNVVGGTGLNGKGVVNETGMSSSDGTDGESAADAAADRAADRSARKNASAGNLDTAPHLLAGQAMGSAAPAIGKAVGRLALARFGAGTLVDGAGVPSSGAPIELGVAKSGNILALKTNSRDLGNVDPLAASTAIVDAGQLLNAVMTAEQSAQNRAKKAMDLIK